MSVLFAPRHKVESLFTSKRNLHFGGIDTVLLGKDLWDRLSTHSMAATIAISISSCHSVRKPSSFHNLSCWAILDQEISGAAIPSAWLDDYRHIFHQHADILPFQTTIAISLAQHICLTEVFVTALSDEAYQAALGPNSFLEDALSADRLLLRQGTIYTFESDILLFDGNGNEPLKNQYRLDMAEPVCQGFAEKHRTRFILTSGSSLKKFTQTGLPRLEEEYDVDQERIEIDEHFLAGSVLSGTPIPASVDNLFSPASYLNGYFPSIGNASKALPASSQEFRFQLQQLLEPVAALQDNHTLYLRTADLGRIGVQSGDWAIVRSCQVSQHRFVRIVAKNDNVIQSAGTAFGSPILIHNICPEPSLSTPTYVSIHASVFGSRELALPTAQAVTIARIASPLSVDGVYQSLLLSSLKAFFSGEKHLVKKGDIIAIGIDTDFAQHVNEFGLKEDDAGSINDVNFSHSSNFSERNNEVVYFIITNIEHDVLSDSTPQMQDSYFGSSSGELGCWIDATVTRIVQTGVDHSFVPDVGTYLGADAGSPKSILAEYRKLHASRLIGPGSPFRKLYDLVSATFLNRAADYNLHLSVLLKGSRGTGKYTVASWVAQLLGMHLLEINCYDVVQETDVKTEGTLRARFDRAEACSPCILVLRHIEAFAQTTQALEAGKEPILTDVLCECISNLQNSWKMAGYPTFLIGTTSEHDKVPTGVLSCFKHEVTVEAPEEVERYEILSSLLVNDLLGVDVSLSTLAVQTAALVACDLANLVKRARFSSIQRAISKTRSCEEADLVQACIPITTADFNIALAKARASYSEGIGAPKIPNVSWDDVGGLMHIKSDILDTIQLPLDHPELFAEGLKKRSGILLYGPPGTGKTLLAKAVATSCSLNFFSVKGPELLNMYIGESEANVRRVFQRARDAKPCVIFFDELDSVAPKRGNHGDSGGVMDRIVSQLLAELDGMSSGKGGEDVFVIGATNRPDLLDPALLRPGRFDRMLYLGVSETHDAQLHILEALTRRFRLDSNLDLRGVAEGCPFNYTGADMYALCSDAMLNAMSRKANELEAKIASLNDTSNSNVKLYPLTPQYYLAEMASAEDIEVLVSKDDFDLALRELVPSVSQSEMHHYANIQKKFSRSSTEHVKE